MAASEIDDRLGIVVTKTGTPQTYATASTGFTLVWPGGIVVFFPWTEATLQRPHQTPEREADYRAHEAACTGTDGLF